MSGNALDRDEVKMALRRLWSHIETCECPTWAVGDHSDQALEIIARVVLGSGETAAQADPATVGDIAPAGELTDSPHRCFTVEGEWVACPASLCEADFVLREYERLNAELNERQALSALRAAINAPANEAKALLHECLWDERAWEPEELTALMEKVYVLLGGHITGTKRGT